MKPNKIFYNFFAAFMMLFLSIPALAVGNSALSGGPFQCDDTMYVVQGDNEGQLYYVDTTTNPYSYVAIGDPYPEPYNAMGYNTQDNYLYAMINKTPGSMNHLLKIDSNGDVVERTAVAGLPEANWNSGVFDGDGNFFIRSGGSQGDLYKVDVANKTAVQVDFQKGINTYDLAWNPVNGLMYGMSIRGQFFSFHPEDAVDSFTLIGDWHGTAIFGGMMANKDGEVYGFQHRTGYEIPVGFYKFNLDTGAPEFISDALPSENGDMAFCTSTNVPTGECDDTIYVVQGDTEAQLYAVNGGFAYSPIGDPYDGEYNALGYNGADGELYAILNKPEDGINILLNVNKSTGEVTELGTINGLPSGNWNSGAFDDNGNYYVRTNGKNGKLYKVNVVSKTAVEIPFPSGVINDYDLAWNPQDGYLYGVSLFGQLFKFDPNDASATLEMIGAAGLNGTGLFGGVMCDANGKIIAFQHRDNSGYTMPVGFYEFDTGSGQASFLAPAKVSVFGDMAFCAGSEILSECDDNIYVVAGNDNEGKLYLVDSSFNYSQIGETYDRAYNALGYNPNDGFLYAMINKTPGENNHLLKINKNDGSVIDLGAVTDLPEDNYNSGVFDGAGKFWIRASSSKGKLYKVDVDAMTAENIPFSPGSQRNTYDLAWNPKDGYMYGVTLYGQLFKFHPTDPNGTYTDIGIAHGSGIFGGLMSDADGRIFGFQHRAGLFYEVGFYEFDTNTGHATKLADAPAELNGDMAFCALGSLDIVCDIELTAVTDDECVETDGTYTVIVSLTGTSSHSEYTIEDSLGNSQNIYLGEEVEFTYVEGSHPSFFAYPTNDEDSSCVMEAGFEEPVNCEELADDLEEPCNWIVRVWSANNGEGTSWYFKDGTGEVFSVEDHGPTYNDIYYFTAPGPVTFHLDASGDNGYRSVNYNVFRNGVKAYHGRARNEVVELNDLMCDGGDKPAAVQSSDFDFSYFPNPANDVLNIDSSKEVKNVQAYSVAGNQVMNTTLNKNNQVDVTRLEAGIYVFRTIFTDGSVETFKVVITR